ncbi:hypothetical protein V1J52_14090 [Streptomyces sp. TRM 70351]|uniref:hypothetical protein n=1 Tax=Streptomyces sp. TRM 70351 TaxID=3116552 RepID=UPI002E7B0B50|nr:hypothetical protein [Streptomyces sp. TRM 70351]MEE1929296.1 hypothetical protein [Streptomyces sp. TRM 70351]
MDRLYAAGADAAAEPAPAADLGDAAAPAPAPAAPPAAGAAETGPAGAAAGPPEPEAGSRPLGVGVRPTGHPGVDAGLRRLEAADHLAVAAHLSVYEDVHRGLRTTLAALDEHEPGS